jgi:hypothetical protein
MKVTVARTVVQTDDVLTCIPDYDEPIARTSKVSQFKRLPTNLTSHPVIIRLESLGQAANLAIASTASPSSVEDHARFHRAQAVKFVEPRPTVLIPNNVDILQILASFAVSIITAGVRANLQQDSGDDEVSVSPIVVDGRGQYRSENVMLQRDSGHHGIAACCNAMNDRKRNLPVFDMFPKDESGYRIHDAQWNVITTPSDSPQNSRKIRAETRK